MAAHTHPCPTRHHSLTAVMLAAVMLAAVVLTGCVRHGHRFTVDVMNSYTPVKDQGQSQTCWVYAMLAAIETEHIMRGDSVHLSAAFVERMMEQDSLVPASRRGVAMALLTLIDRYGTVPYGAVPDDDPDLPLPRYAYMLGCRYTPQEFAHSVCAPNEYIAMGSSDKHPYYQPYTMDVPDNWEHHSLMNMPPDSLLSVTERAVRLGHGVCWEGDISERGFSFEEGEAVTWLLSGSTTDDHCMAIVGLAHDEDGKPYFVMKNSWGTQNRYHGLMFMSYDYFREKTLAIVTVRDLSADQSQHRRSP